VTPAGLSAVVVTRGNVPLEPILDSFTAAGIFDFVVWDNSLRPDDLGVFGRYAALPECGRDIVLVQDDDVILPAATIEALAAAYEPGRIVANMPERFRKFYSDSCLVGFGAVFDRLLVDRTFDRFLESWDEKFLLRRPDVVFTALAESTWLDLPYTEREFATGPDRAYRQKGHVQERQRVLAMARKARRTVIAS
jgi:hypothetical protein